MVGSCTLGQLAFIHVVLKRLPELDVFSWFFLTLALTFVICVMLVRCMHLAGLHFNQTYLLIKADLSQNL